jgi:Lrp/AsnC family leucine-responsive transcriptional regulator
MVDLMAETAQLDSFDIQILRALRSDGRLSVQNLSELIGLSPTPTARRLKRLEETGIIKGYSALIDEVALGYTVTVFVSVQLDRQVDDALVSFEAAIDAFPEVVDCWLMTGNRDYMMRVVTADLREFEHFLVQQLTKVPGVSTIESSIPLRRVKDGQARML